MLCHLSRTIAPAFAGNISVNRYVHDAGGHVIVRVCLSVHLCASRLLKILWIDCREILWRTRALVQETICYICGR